MSRPPLLLFAQVSQSVGIRGEQTSAVEMAHWNAAKHLVLVAEPEIHGTSQRDGLVRHQKGGRTPLTLRLSQHPRSTAWLRLVRSKRQTSVGPKLHWEMPCPAA